MKIIEENRHTHARAHKLWRAKLGGRELGVAIRLTLTMVRVNVGCREECEDGKQRMWTAGRAVDRSREGRKLNVRRWENRRRCKESVEKSGWEGVGKGWKRKEMDGVDG